MDRKVKFMLAASCSAAMLFNSVSVFSQDKDKKQETSVQKQVFINRDGKTVEVPGGGVWISDSEPGKRMSFSFSGTGAGVGDVPQIEFVHNEFHFDSNVVKGAPYSADAVTEFVQTLGDGNRIVRNSSSRVFRDSVGRTRREQALNAIGSWAVAGETPVTISISDPVAGVQYSLNPRTKTASKNSVHRITVSGDDKGSIHTFSRTSSGVTVKGEGKSDQIKFVTDDNRTITISGENPDKAVAEVKMRKAANAGVMTDFSVEGGRVMAIASDAEVNRESLGTQMIEGVMAEGTRVTYTIPAGKIGNDRPIVTVSERWYSPELQTVVMSKNSDPRSGETTYRLTNINRSEPDPSLFQIPGDYTIKESSFNFTTRPDIGEKIRLESDKKNRKPNEN